MNANSFLQFYSLGVTASLSFHLVKRVIDGGVGLENKHLEAPNYLSWLPHFIIIYFFTNWYWLDEASVQIYRMSMHRHLADPSAVLVSSAYTVQ